MSDVKKENSDRYLCFSLGTEQFSCPLMLVKEVVGQTEFTTVPHAPNYFLGIMNLRGQVISVIDLKKKFGVKPKNQPDQAVIIFDIEGISIGVSVDSVDYVANVTQTEVVNQPELVFPQGAEYLTGVFRKDQKLIIVLDLVRVFTKDEKLMLKNRTAKAA